MTIDYQDDPNKLVNKLCQNDGKSLDHRLKNLGGGRDRSLGGEYCVENNKRVCKKNER